MPVYESEFSKTKNRLHVYSIVIDTNKNEVRVNHVRNNPVNPELTSSLASAFLKRKPHSLDQRLAQMEIDRLVKVITDWEKD